MSTCVEWEGAVLSTGYGQVYIGRSPGGKKVRERAHRFEWMKRNGPIPKGMLIRHTCDNPICYNIEHLEIGTQQDNMNDMHSRGRNHNSNKTHCKNGHEYTVDNTYIRKNGGRNCVTCTRERHKSRKVS